MQDALMLVLIGLFTVFSGFNDGGNLLAAFLNTRSMKSYLVIAIILVAMLVAPLFIGTRVAETIGTQIVDLKSTSASVFDVGIAATLVSLYVCWRIGVPTSITFALTGGLAGAALVADGSGAIVWAGLLKVVVSLIAVVIVGGITGVVVYSVIFLLIRIIPFRYSSWLQHAQYISSLLVSIGYGGNDAEKSLGLLAVAIGIMHHQAKFRIEWWMIPAVVLVFALGLVTGGIRVAKTVSRHVYQIRPIHALSTQMASAALVLTASAFGGPASTTQTIDSALIGVGLRSNKSRIRFAAVRQIVWVWIFTMPLAFVVSGFFELLIRMGEQI